MEPPSTGLRGLGDPAGPSSGTRADKRGAGNCSPNASRRERTARCVHGTGAEGLAKNGAHRTTPEARTGGQGCFDGSLWTGGRQRLPLTRLCGADGHCLPGARCGRHQLPGQNWKQEPRTAVTRQPAGRREVRARTQTRRSAHALSPPVRLPAFESNDRMGGTRLRQSAARVLDSAVAVPGGCTC